MSVSVKMFAVERPLEQGHRHAPVGNILRPAGAKRSLGQGGWVGSVARCALHGLATTALLLQATIGWAQSSQSPYCTTVVAVGPAIIDAFGNKWSLTSGANVAENDITDTSTFNVVKLVYNLGYIYQQNTVGNWYRRNANVGWVGVDAPACPTSTPTALFGWSQTSDNTLVGTVKILVSVPSALTSKMFLDNIQVAFAPPSAWQWDTTKVPNGSHTIREDDVDTNGAVVSTSSTIVNIAN